METKNLSVSEIPSNDDLFGASAIILTADYFNQEFFRVGFYIYNAYQDP